MQKSDFEVRFPSSSRHFDWTSEGRRLWIAEARQRGIVYPMPFYASACDLLSHAASWHSREDMFKNYRFFSRLYTLIQELDFMPRKATNTVKRAAWKGFLDFRLGEGELQELDEWSPTAPEIWESVDTLLRSNFRVTLSYSAATQTSTCTIIDDDPQRASGGWALASSDRDGALALKTAVYKHFLVLEGSWERLLDLPAAGGRRG